MSLWQVEAHDANLNGELPFRIQSASGSPWNICSERGSAARKAVHGGTRTEGSEPLNYRTGRYFRGPNLKICPIKSRAFFSIPFSFFLLDCSTPITILQHHTIIMSNVTNSSTAAIAGENTTIAITGDNLNDGVVPTNHLPRPAQWTPQSRFLRFYVSLSATNVITFSFSRRSEHRNISSIDTTCLRPRRPRKSLFTLSHHSKSPGIF